MRELCLDLGLDEIARRLTPASVGVSVLGRCFDASDDVAHDLETDQFVLGEGPIGDVVDVGQPIQVCDVDHAHYWPEFDKHLAECSMRAVFSMPLRTTLQVYGALTVYRLAPGDPGAQQVNRLLGAARKISLALERHLTAGIVEHGVGCGVHRADRLYRAIGMVIGDLGLPSDEASSRIRSHAYAIGRPLDEVIDDLLGRQSPVGLGLTERPSGNRHGAFGGSDVGNLVGVHLADVPEPHASCDVWRAGGVLDVESKCQP